MQMLLFELEGVVGLSRKGSSPVAPSSPSSSSSELTQNNQFKLWNVYTADMTASVFQPLTSPPPNPTRFQAEIFSCPGDRDLTLSPVSSRWQSSVWVSWFPPRFASWGLKILTRPLAVGAKTEGITERLTRVIAALKIKKKKKKVPNEIQKYIVKKKCFYSSGPSPPALPLWACGGDMVTGSSPLCSQILNIFIKPIFW